MRLSLETDRGPVDLKPFVERLCGNLCWGILQSLHVPTGIQRAEFEMSDDDLRILASGQEIPLVNPFAKRLVTDLLKAVLMNLKGVGQVKHATFRFDRGE